MKKTALKAVATETNDADRINDITEHLYFAKATLAVLAGLDPAQPDAFEKGHVSYIALEAKTRLDKALDLLNP